MRLVALALFEATIFPAPTKKTQQRVRPAILAQEHVALGRRYRDFVLAHIGPSFFREEATSYLLPARRRDLPGMLERAYRFRSRYVHTLRELPRIMTAAPSRGDIVNVEGEPVLTFQGLARVARHAIRAFVERGQKVEREDFDYRSALPNVVRVQLAESFWLHSADGYTPHGRARGADTRWCRRPARRRPRRSRCTSSVATPPTVTHRRTGRCAHPHRLGGAGQPARARAVGASRNRGCS